MSTEADIVERLAARIERQDIVFQTDQDWLTDEDSELICIALRAFPEIIQLRAERDAAADRVLTLVDPWTRGAFTGWKGKTGASRITLDQAEEHFSICMADMMHDVRAELSKVAPTVIATERDT